MRRHPQILLCVLTLTVLLVAGCGGEPAGLTGTWSAAAPDGSTVTLELAEGGIGTWSAGQEAAEVRWSTGGGLLILHTKAGGVLTGRPAEGGWRFEVPGSGVLVFKRR